MTRCFCVCFLKATYGLDGGLVWVMERRDGCARVLENETLTNNLNNTNGIIGVRNFYVEEFHCNLFRLMFHIFTILNGVIVEFKRIYVIN